MSLSPIVKKRRFNKVSIISSFLLVLAAFFYLSPFYWMISTAFKVQADIISSPVHLVPPRLTLFHMANVFTEYGGFKSLLDSLIIASVVTVICIILGTFAAYSLARFKTGGKNLAFWILSNRMLPPMAFVLPFFILFKNWGFIDKYRGLIFAYLIFDLPFAIWILRGFFYKIPTELDESAMIDGASTITVLFRIILPLAGPGIAATAFLCFVFSWNEFLFAFLLTRGAVRTIPVLIPMLYGGHDILYGEVSAISMVATIPMIILVIFFRRYLVTGLTLGAIK